MGGKHAGNSHGCLWLCTAAGQDAGASHEVTESRFDVELAVDHKEYCKGWHPLADCPAPVLTRRPPPSRAKFACGSRVPALRGGLSGLRAVCDQFKGPKLRNWRGLSGTARRVPRGDRVLGSQTDALHRAVAGHFPGPRAQFGASHVPR